MLCLIFGKNHNFKTGQRWVCGGFVWFSWYVCLVGVVLVLFVVFGFGFFFNCSIDTINVRRLTELSLVI